MPSLYRRLKSVGYDRGFVRRVILPDWWDDALADDPSMLLQIQLRVARRLGVPLKVVADANGPLALPETKTVRLKRAKEGSCRDDIAPGIVIARHTVALAVAELRDIPPFPAQLTAADLRAFILKTYPVVDFAGLVKAAWAHGIAVFHFREWPRGAKKFAGMAYYEGKTPVIVIASGYDMPPKLAFYLAHELGHILRGHVKPDGKVLVDGDLESEREDVEEIEADNEALAILCGTKALGTSLGKQTPASLRVWAKKIEARDQIHAGTAVLSYGRAQKQNPMAMMVLKGLQMDTGAHAIIAAEMRRQLLPDKGATDARDLPVALREILPLLGVADV
jgi:Zn-dependent peptidase ImmA (M78 family)